MVVSTLVLGGLGVGFLWGYLKINELRFRTAIGRMHIRDRLKMYCEIPEDTLLDA